MSKPLLPALPAPQHALPFHGCKCALAWGRCDWTATAALRGVVFRNCTAPPGKQRLMSAPMGQHIISDLGDDNKELFRMLDNRIMFCYQNIIDC